jgi:2-(1,2-epoxy-1,2-dihydrophenyl)acetyl-CoA isomerase
VTSDVTRVERRDGLVVVTLDRPTRKNAVTATNWRDLEEILTEVEVSSTDRALLLTGAGGDFSAGADLSGEDSGGGLTGHGVRLIVHEMRTMGDIVARLQRLTKPTLAAVDGVAVGVGLGLAAACDLIVASDRARFIQVFAKRGLALDGGTSWTLPRAIGLRRAKQMAFFGDPVDARTAYEWGLVNEVVPADELQATALAWGRRLAAGPTTALSLTKRMLDASFGSSFEEAVDREATAQHICYTTADMKEGFRAWMERRDPAFTGE